MTRTYRFTYRIIAALLVLAAPAVAQAPRVSAVFPPGIQRTAGGSLTLSGEHFKAGSRVLVSGEGVAAAVGSVSEKELTVQLTVAPEAASGVRELRVLGPNGASNAARFAVGTLPGRTETEPNNGPEHAQALSELPALVYGRIDPLGDEDTFRFHAGAGETWVFDLGSASHASPLDGFLVLRDAGGRELASLLKAGDQDPRLIHTFAAAGDYTLSVRDVAYRGGPEWTYRLAVGQLPTVTRVLPMGVHRGQTTTVQLAGFNLSGMATMDVTVPADYADSTLTVAPKTPGGDAQPMKLAVSSLPEAVEAEPNDDRSKATRLPALPGAISGVISPKGDVDFYAFHAEAGQKLLFDLFARRLGTRLDSFLRVTDRTGRELATNDDAVGKDSRLMWTAPSPGEYYVQVSDLTGQGGDDYGYRLEVTAAPAPDFKLTVTPDVVNIPRGSAEVLTVRVERLNEFTGDVALRVEGLPAGVAASPGMLPKGMDTEQITLTAPPDLSIDGFPLRVVGAATIDGKAVERAAQPMESLKIGDEDRGQRPTTFEVAGVREAIAYGVTVEPQQVTLAPGEKAKLTVKLTRPKDGDAAKSPIGLFVMNLPPGVDQVIPDIPADKSEGTIELKAAEKLEARQTHLIVRTRIDKDYRYVPAIPLTLLPKAPATGGTQAAK